MADRPGERNCDAGAKVGGRKRHLLVDTLALVFVAVVHGAEIHDRDGARMVLEKALISGWLRVVFADGGYAGQLVAWVRNLFRGQGARLGIASRNKPSCHVLPTRWIFEHAFFWLIPFWRLVKDYEVKTGQSEAFIYASAARLVMHRSASHHDS